jgi:hypothetical protein
MRSLEGAEIPGMVHGRQKGAQGEVLPQYQQGSQLWSLVLILLDQFVFLEPFGLALALKSEQLNHCCLEPWLQKRSTPFDSW